MNPSPGDDLGEARQSEGSSILSITSGSLSFGEPIPGTYSIPSKVPQFEGPADINRFPSPSNASSATWYSSSAIVFDRSPVTRSQNVIPEPPEARVLLRAPSTR